MKQDCHFIDPLIQTKKMMICCGSGGVGKTTTAAAIGLRAVQLGKKVVVLTIDPAKRLANSLGLSELGNDIRQIDLAALGLKPTTGELWAMMLDCKRTFDELVVQYAGSDEVRDKILGNRFYQHISNTLTGSHEYMAMEKLYDIHQQNRFDLVILDTPPTHNALDFLDAPKRMTDFLDDSVLKWFLKPYFIAGKVSFKTIEKGGLIVFKILERITGMSVLQDISEFFLSFTGMYEGFKARAAAVSKLLRSADSAFVLVTSPHAVTLDECRFFHQKLKEFSMPFGGVIVNKVHPNFDLQSGESEAQFLQEVAASSLPKNPEAQAAAKFLWRNLQNMQALHVSDEKNIDKFVRETGETALAIRLIPFLDRDVFDLGELQGLAELI